MLSQNDKISLIIPVYNEEEAVKETLDKAKQVMASLELPFEIIVVNDASKDKSREILSKEEGIKLINNPYNLGYGASLKKGIRESSGNWIIITDADGTYPIAEIPKFVELAGDYDMVVGARSEDQDHFGRRPAKWVLKKIAGFLAGRKIPDLNSGMRIFRKSIALEFYHLFPSRFSFTSTITLACLANDYTVKFLPIPYYKRKGSSDIRPRHFFDFITLIIKLFVYFKPLKMLSPFALVSLVLGVSKGIRDIIVEGYIGTLASLLIIFAFQIFLLALISEVIIRKSSNQ